MAENKNKKIKRMTNGSNFMNFSMITAAISLLIMAVLGWGLSQPLPNKINSQWQDQQVDNKVSEIELYINLKYGQIDSLLEGLVKSQSAMYAVDNDDQRAKQLVINQAEALVPGYLSANIYSIGKIEADPNATPAVTFEAVDMINRTLKGRPVGAEVKNDHILWSKAIRDANGRISGALTVFTDKGTLSRISDSLDANAGQIVIEQNVGNTPIQVFSFGLNGDASKLKSFSVDNPNWTVKYSPSTVITSSQVFNPISTIIPIAIIAVLILILILVAGQITYNALRKDMHKVAELIKFVEDGGRPDLPQFNISAFAALANRILRLQVNGGGKLSSVASSIPDEVSKSNELVPAIGVMMNPEIFRAYDIRGISDRTLDKRVAYDIGRAYGSECRKNSQNTVIVGRDGRNTSAQYSKYLCEGIMSAGVSVVDVGEVPTPVVYFAAKHLNIPSTVVVTGSHNAANYNGFKFTLGDRTLAGSDIAMLKNRIEADDYEKARKAGVFSSKDVVDAYIAAIVDTIVINKKLRIVIDCGNGVTGHIAPKLFKALGCKVLPLYAEVDGNFPNHHPDPSNPANLEMLIKTVQETSADIGIAFDGDGDRVGVVTNRGNVIQADTLLMLFARDILSRETNSTVVYDVKCSRRLNSLIRGFGGKPVIWKSGHSMIKNKMRESHAVLGGELSGHFFIADRWYGFDDGMYAGVRLLELLAQSEGDSDFLFSSFPHDESTIELYIPANDTRKFELMQMIMEKADTLDGEIIDIDGLRVDYPDGWGLVRVSNTTPALSLRFEGDTEMAVQAIQQKFKALLLRVDPQLQIPF
jgi:phosphomannomutase / phosphoglucomutase